MKGKDGNSRYRFKYNTEVEEKDTAEWNLDLPFLKKRKSEWHPMFGGINVGAPPASIFATTSIRKRRANIS